MESTPLFIGLLAGGSVLCFLFALRSNPPMARRVRRLRAADSPQVSHTPQALAIAPPSRVERLLARLEGGLGWLGVDNDAERRRLAISLAHAGVRRQWAVLAMQVALVILPAVACLLAFGAMPLLYPPAGMGARLLAGLVGILAGAAAPRLWLTNRIRKRQHALAGQLADALDLYIICVDAGLGFDAATARVARELGPAAPELADELQLTAIELGLLPDRHEAFGNLLRRVPLPEFRGLVGMFQQAERYGTPLSEALRRLVAEYRTERMLRAEEKAARLPALLTVPMIIFVLPPLFIVLLGPALLQLLAMQ